MCTRVRDRTPVLTVVKTSHIGVILETTSRVRIREVRDIPVKSVTECLIRRVTLINTSRVCTWERNRTPVLFVEKTLQRKLTSSYTTGLSIRVRNRTSAQIVDRSLHRGVILIDISREPTMPRNHIPVRIVVKTFQRKQNSFYTYGVYTRERNPTLALCVVKGLV